MVQAVCVVWQARLKSKFGGRIIGSKVKWGALLEVGIAIVSVDAGEK